ncbi:MAG: glycine cleavage system protein GcvH [Alphaproteobacteria bacterium]
MLKFTQDHEWIRLEADGSATVGITQYAQEQLGDVVFVELPALGKEVAKGGDAAVVESVKAASEVYAPASGKVVAVNDKLTGEPALVNSSPMAEGWFFKLDLKDKGELAALMDEAAYGKFCEGLH